MADAFDGEQKKRMENVASEFHLEAAGPDAWQMVEVYTQVFRHERGARQPGEPLTSTFPFENPGQEQSLHWIVTAEGGDVSQIQVSIDQGGAVVLPVTLREGWSLRYEGGAMATLRDTEHRVSGTVAVADLAFRIAPGRHAVTLGARLHPEQEAKARLELRPRGRVEAVTPQRVSGTLGSPPSQ